MGIAKREGFDKRQIKVQNTTEEEPVGVRQGNKKSWVKGGEKTHQPNIVHIKGEKFHGVNVPVPESAKRQGWGTTGEKVWGSGETGRKEQNSGRGMTGPKDEGNINPLVRKKYTGGRTGQEADVSLILMGGGVEKEK